MIWQEFTLGKLRKYTATTHPVEGLPGPEPAAGPHPAVGAHKVHAALAVLRVEVVVGGDLTLDLISTPALRYH